MVLIYFVIVPYLYTPSWCLQYFKDQGDQDQIGFTYNCHLVVLDGGLVPYSNMPKLAPWLTAIIDVICLSYLTFYRMYKLKWRKMTKKGTVRNYALVIILVVSITDHVLGLIFSYNSLVSLLLRPLVVYIFFSSVRNNLWMIAYTCKDTGIILVTILSYVMLFSVFSYYLFRNDFEGIAILSDMFESYYQFLILLTTANFPDVMLPAYERSFWYSSIFVLYLIVGLYFLLNILLANVFSMYKKRHEQKL